MTWMIEAHSAFLSMSATDAFWTLRILPRIGSSAWNSELRASLAVPIAESPSTMNSSERSTSVVRQSRSLAGRVELSRAFLRRWVSLCSRALMRDFISETTFSSSSADCALSPRLVEVRRAVSSCLDDLGDDGAHRVGAEDLLGLPLELRLGQPHRDDGGHAGEDVVLLRLVVADLEPPGVELELLAEDLEQRLLEAGDVGAALGRRDDVDEGLHPRVVALAPAQRDVDDALALELGGGHVPVDVEDRHGLGEGAGALEAPDVGDGGVGSEELDELGDAAVVVEDLLDRPLRAGRAREAGARRG